MTSMQILRETLKRKKNTQSVFNNIFIVKIERIKYQNFENIKLAQLLQKLKCMLSITLINVFKPKLI